MSALTVLSPQKDPYRLDTAAHHRDGAWFAAQVKRFVLSGGNVHLRGLHYRVVAAGGVLRPEGLPYISDDDAWEFLSEKAAKAARWLGYVPFERIVDGLTPADKIHARGARNRNHYRLVPWSLMRSANAGGGLA